MVKLNPGDVVVCLVKDNKIVNIYETLFDKKEEFAVISSFEGGHHLLVPAFSTLKHTIKIDNNLCKKFGIDIRFMGSDAVLITQYNVYLVKHKLDGMFCGKCNAFNKYAEANTDDKKFICWNCRKWPHFASSPDED